jgi:hypothetical protein
MSVYQQVLDIAREQSAALGRGELEAATKLLDHRAQLLVNALVPTPDEIPLIEEIMQLDRDLSSAIRERMIKIRNEVLDGQQGRRALNSYGRRLPRQPLAIDRVS